MCPRAVAADGQGLRRKSEAQGFGRDQSQFISAPSPVYGEQNVTLRYRAIDLLWRPPDGCALRHSVSSDARHDLPAGHDLTLEPLEIVCSMATASNRARLPASRACRRKLRIPLLDGRHETAPPRQATSICTEKATLTATLSAAR